MEKFQFASKALLAGVMAIPSIPLEAKEKVESKPNIVIVFTDDQGYGDVGCFGAKGFKTPNIDKLAKNGMKLTSFYVAAPVCTPSRASLMTGCYAERVDMSMVIHPSKKPVNEQAPANRRGINPKEELLPELLKNEGYTTACVGKWHMGHHAPFLPHNNGFDEYFGLPYSNDMIPTRMQSYPDMPLMKNDEIVELNPDQHYLTKRFAEYSVDFIKRNKEKPFFLYLAHSMPHIPIFASPKFEGKSDAGLYGDVMEEIDWSVGQVVKSLKKAGVYENTIVIFTSDNGPWLVFGNHGGSAGPLREGKGTTFEGGQRVPCVISWPGHIAAGSKTDQMVTALDILPTVMNIVGGELPKEKIDGTDVTDLLLGKVNATGHAKPFYYIGGKRVRGVRLGDWKLMLPGRYGTVVEAGKDGNVGKRGNIKLEMSLFNLKEDIGESTNLADKHPEMVEKLVKLAADFKTELKENKRPCGIIERK